MGGTKTVLVTGCTAGGIGGALALALAKEGHQVIATARNTSKIAPELFDYSNVTILELDVTSTRSVRAAAEETEERGVDVVVNNAAGNYPMPILDVDIDEAKKLHDTNVWGPVRVVQAFSKHLIKSRGRVVNMNSSACGINAMWIGPYLSSKVALKKISDVLRLELAPFGVSVVTIMVGIVSTNAHANTSSFVLPPSSQYSSIKENITTVVAGDSMPEGSDSPEEFAKSVMDDIVGDVGEPVVWRGACKDFFRSLSQLPIEQLDAAMREGKGLESLGKTDNTGA